MTKKKLKEKNKLLKRIANNDRLWASIYQSAIRNIEMETKKPEPNIKKIIEILAGILPMLPPEHINCRPIIQAIECIAITDNTTKGFNPKITSGETDID